MPTTYEKADDNTIKEIVSETKTIETERKWNIPEIKAKIIKLQALLTEAEKLGIDIK